MNKEELSKNEIFILGKDTSLQRKEVSYGVVLGLAGPVELLHGVASGGRWLTQTGWVIQPH